ncbi:hypothetical protein [Kitasatospora sp. A2-31]|uniref:hypothetical protein n=1 Tax=Kitasatospora sp. A2-31 TaxID=2916414 RepID=UPI001EEE2FBF|nr:hypothetical protein [Kitasatospora sp. A2-31]MCG6499423.1 hypothetical protein [Kitasatospora sp. A2-31]
MLAAFLRRRQPEAADPATAIRLLKADRARDREHILRLEAMLRTEARRAEAAEQALDEFRTAIRDGHAAVIADNARLRREVELVRRDRESALRQLDDALGYDAKTLATIAAGGTRAAA